MIGGFSSGSECYRDAAVVARHLPRLKLLGVDSFNPIDGASAQMAITFALQQSYEQLTDLHIATHSVSIDHSYPFPRLETLSLARTRWMGWDEPKLDPRLSTMASIGLPKLTSLTLDFPTDIAHLETLLYSLRSFQILQRLDIRGTEIELSYSHFLRSLPVILDSVPALQHLSFYACTANERGWEEMHFADGFTHPVINRIDIRMSQHNYFVAKTLSILFRMISVNALPALSSIVFDGAFETGALDSYLILPKRAKQAWVKALTISKQAGVALLSTSGQNLFLWSDLHSIKYDIETRSNEEDENNSTTYETDSDSWIVQDDDIKPVPRSRSPLDDIISNDSDDFAYRYHYQPDVDLHPSTLEMEIVSD